MAQKMPWFKFYPSDYMRDPKVMALSFEAQGFLVKLWCLCSQEPGAYLPASPEDSPQLLAKLLGTNLAGIRRLWPQVSAFFVRDTGVVTGQLPDNYQGTTGVVFYSKRMRAEQEANEEYARKQRETAQKAGQASAAKRANARSTPVGNSVEVPDQRPFNHARATESESDTESENVGGKPPTTPTPLPPASGGGPDAGKAPAPDAARPDTAGRGPTAPDPAGPQGSGTPDAEPERPKPRRRPPKPKPPGADEESLEDILGPKGPQTSFSRFWQFAGQWPRSQIHSPKSLARAWLKATGNGDADAAWDIHCAAIAYREGFLPPIRAQDETQYMKNPLTWLREEAWKADFANDEN
jgi:hypothetical protein